MNTLRAFTCSPWQLHCRSRGTPGCSRRRRSTTHFRTITIRFLFLLRFYRIHGIFADWCSLLRVGWTAQEYPGSFADWCSLLRVGWTAQEYPGSFGHSSSLFNGGWTSSTGHLKSIHVFSHTGFLCLVLDEHESRDI